MLELSDLSLSHSAVALAMLSPGEGKAKRIKAALPNRKLSELKPTEDVSSAVKHKSPFCCHLLHPAEQRART